MRYSWLVFGIFIWMPISVLAANITMTLDVRVSPGQNMISGHARLASNKAIETTLALENIRRLEIDGNDLTVSGKPVHVSLSPGNDKVLSFKTVIPPSRQNYMDPENVFLTGNWFPQPNELIKYDLTVTLPKGFLAISEADFVKSTPSSQTVTYRFEFNHPVDGLSLAASRNYIRKVDKYKDVDLEAYFFAEDMDLAEDYLTFTKKYLAMYEEMLTPYPYRRFVIAENILPTGYSMPTYTLLGKAVVRLPFITRTSLGHEVLHQWFGNAVYIDFAKGNWAEGLTNYLADHLYADLKNEGAAYRKQILINYDAYINDTTKMPVSQFYSRHNKAESAIGYGKSAMIFHGLRQRLGDKVFYGSLRDFLTARRFQKATWADIQKSFEKVSALDLTLFFDQWLKRSDIPRLTIEDAGTVVEKGELTVQFSIVQTEPPYRLRVPIAVLTPGKTTYHTVEISKKREVVRLVTDDVPTQVVVDPQYNLMRALDQRESPATLSRMMGKKKVLVVSSTKFAEKYQPILDALGVKDLLFVAPNKVTLEEIVSHSVIFLGYQLSPVKMIFGRQPEFTDGVRLRVEKNPYNPDEAIMLLHVNSISEAEAIKRKLPHYGKYAKLIFNQGNIVLKEKSQTPAGLLVLNRPEATVIQPDKIDTLEDILPALKKHRIVYVGEQHDKYAHHMNQLKIIKKLHGAGIKLAVGMEMFQTPYQQPIDDYLAGRIDERRFLKASAYFDKWRFDYNLYKPILDYLKKEKIPLVALNIDGDISRKVARKGIDALNEKEKIQIPPEMDFTDTDYREDLFEVFRLHDDQHQLKTFDYFLQAQVLWDETMAESVHRYLANQSDRSMVVLAGNGHIRNKYGIPQRVFRRNGLPFIVIAQDENLQAGIADYVLQTVPLKGKKAPLLGVSIDAKDQAVSIEGVIENSPAGKAGMKKGDTIYRIGDQKIQSLADLKFALFYTSAGDTVSVGLIRDGEEISKKLTLFGFKNGK